MSDTENIICGIWCLHPDCVYVVNDIFEAPIDLYNHMLSAHHRVFCNYCITDVEKNVLKLYPYPTLICEQCNAFQHCCLKCQKDDPVHINLCNKFSMQLDTQITKCDADFTRVYNISVSQTLDNSMCPICLESMKDKITHSCGWCGNKYCVKCLKIVASTRNSTCPKCRFSLGPEGSITETSQVCVSPEHFFENVCSHMHTSLIHTSLIKIDVTKDLFTKNTVRLCCNLGRLSIVLNLIKQLIQKFPDAKNNLSFYDSLYIRKLLVLICWYLFGDLNYMPYYLRWINTILQPTKVA